MKLTAEAGAERDSTVGLAVPALGSDVLPLRTIVPSPCARACPAGIDVKAYVSLIAEGRFAEALAVVREHCPLPGVCGRVCTHPCEEACRRENVDEAVAIRALKRFVADLEAEVPFRPPLAPLTRTEKVAVIGSGPAGLTAAYDLRRAGYPVTVFEAEDEPGGMLRHGIAAYRLPHDVLRREIDALLATGIELRTGCRLGVDVGIEGLLQGDYAAVLLAVGAQIGRRLGLPGEEGCDEVQDALAFLREVNNGARPFPGQRVMVIGGGSTAVEAARTARRLGAGSVDILYRRSRAEMPADEEELRAAEAEGIRLRLLVAPARLLLARGRLFALECRRMRLGEPDASGRRRPVALEKSEFLVEADRVLAAVGQQVDLGFLPGALPARLEEEGRLAVDSATGATHLSRVYAAGDVAGGPATVVHAIGTGHRVARTIRAHLERPAPAASEAVAWEPLEFELAGGVVTPAHREEPPHAHVLADPSFPEVEGPFDRDAAIAEARRCLRCGPCSECRICAPSCLHRHARIHTGDEAHAVGGLDLFVRAPRALAEALDPLDPLPCTILHANGQATSASALSEPVELRAAKNRVQADRCRGCLLCADVCPFDAVHALPSTSGADPESGQVARIDPLACRGCGLCSSVCPTHAAIPWTLFPEEWAQRTAALFRAVTTGGPAPCAVLTCRRHAPLWQQRPRLDGRPVALFTFPCVGQIDAGMPLELATRGAACVLVAGCADGDCRYANERIGSGAVLAHAHAEQARALLRLFTTGDERISIVPGNAPLEAIERIVAARRLEGSGGLQEVSP